MVAIGALAASAATLMGHYPWFLVFNYLSETLPSAKAYMDTLPPGRVHLLYFLNYCLFLLFKLLYVVQMALCGICSTRWIGGVWNSPDQLS